MYIKLIDICPSRRRNIASHWIYTDINHKISQNLNVTSIPPRHNDVAKRKENNLALDQSPSAISSYPPSSGRAYVAALIPIAVSASKLQLIVQRIQEVSSFQPVKNLSL